MCREERRARQKPVRGCSGRRREGSGSGHDSESRLGDRLDPVWGIRSESRLGDRLDPVWGIRSESRLGDRLDPVWGIRSESRLGGCLDPVWGPGSGSRLGGCLDPVFGPGSESRLGGCLDPVFGPGSGSRLGGCLDRSVGLVPDRCCLTRFGLVPNQGLGAALARSVGLGSGVSVGCGCEFGRGAARSMPTRGQAPRSTGRAYGASGALRRRLDEGIPEFYKTVRSVAMRINISSNGTRRFPFS